MPRRNGEESAARTPARIEPPIGASGGGSPARGCARAQRPSMMMQTMVSASNAADMSSRPVSSTLDTVLAAMNGPAMVAAKQQEEVGEGPRQRAQLVRLGAQHTAEGGTHAL